MYLKFTLEFEWKLAYDKEHPSFSWRIVVEEHLYISLTLTLLSCSACSLMAMRAVFFRHARNNCYQKKKLRRTKGKSRRGTDVSFTALS